jgi:predicted phosphodiesterase
MRFAIVSDIHGNLPALKAVMAEMERKQVDAVFNLGDIVSGPLWPRETLALLRSQPWPTIRGNHERQLLGDAASMGLSDVQARAQLGEDDLAWLRALPATRRPAEGVLCCHGTPDSDASYFLETVTADYRAGGDPGVRAADADEVRARLGTVGDSLVLCGHTHRARVVTCGGTLIVNPGSVGLQAYDDAHPHPHVVEMGSPHARWALVELRDGYWQAQLRATAYDWSAAADRAQCMGRGDWADALRTGRVGRWERDAERRPPP